MHALRQSKAKCPEEQAAAWQSGTDGQRTRYEDAPGIHTNSTSKEPTVLPQPWKGSRIDSDEIRWQNGEINFSGDPDGSLQPG
jgi:hypothetical protein